MALVTTMLCSPSKGKRDFGSFFSSNIYELINVPDAEYTPAPWPVPVPDVSAAREVAFGAEMRQQYFYHDPDWAFLNHGAFGGALRPAVEFAQSLQIHIERQTLRFFDRELLPLMARVLRRMAKFVDCRPANLVLVQNTTLGSSAVLQCAGLGQGDTVCCFNFTYGAVKKQLKHFCESVGAKINQIEIEFPIRSEEEIICQFEAALSVPGTKFAVVDHIPSNTPMVMPVKRMVQMCRDRNIRILVDGAHALGSLDLHLDDLGADYYVANAHKWLCAPKGCALLYVRPELQDDLHPGVISHGYGHGMTSEFLWAGTKDYTAILALEVVLDFWEAVGVQRIRDHLQGLALKYMKQLAEQWNTDIMIPDSMVACGMTNVRLPAALYSAYETLDYARCEFLQNELYHKHKVEAPLKAIDGHLYARLSTHIYNTDEQVTEFTKAIDQLTRDNALQQCETMTCYQ